MIAQSVVVSSLSRALVVVGKSDLPSTKSLQFFGQVLIDGATEVMTVHLKDLTGETLHTVELTPEV